LNYQILVFILIVAELAIIVKNFIFYCVTYYFIFSDVYIASEIAKANISHHVLTSEVDTEEQEAIAEDWQNS
jgi:hypothetical protein